MILWWALPECDEKIRVSEYQQQVSLCHGHHLINHHVHPRQHQHTNLYPTKTLNNNQECTLLLLKYPCEARISVVESILSWVEVIVIIYYLRWKIYFLCMLCNTEGWPSLISRRMNVKIINDGSVLKACSLDHLIRQEYIPGCDESLIWRQVHNSQS